MERFPNAELRITIQNYSRIFEISHNKNIVVVIDSLGATFHFPTRIRGNAIKWNGVKEGGPEQVADLILRKMADAGFQVLARNGNFIAKSPLKIGKYTYCPQCNAMGKVREILYGMPAEDYDQEKYVLGGCCIPDEHLEIRCTNCDWAGLKPK